MVNFRRMRRSLSILGFTLLVVGPATRAVAQPAPRGNVYAGGSLLFEIKRFSGDRADNVLDGESLGLTLALGSAVAARWDAEVDVDVAPSTENVREQSVILGRSTIPIQSITTNRAVTVAALLRFRPPRRGRVQFGYLAGMSIVSFRRHFKTLAPDVPSSLVPLPSESLDYAAAPAIGVDAQVDLARHLAIVPGLIVTAFDAEDSGGLLLHPRVGVRWTF
jgi:hypothetical protein